MKRYTVICIPGRDDSDEASWFAFDKLTYISKRCEDRDAAVDMVRMLNEISSRK